MSDQFVDLNESSTTDQIGGHLLVECLIAQGVKHVFGVPGESYLAVLDGFHRYQNQIQFVTCRQEGGAAFMADAQGRLTGRPGVCFVTRGPGATCIHWRSYGISRFDPDGLVCWRRGQRHA
jgi:glyoxylate carboligase